ncbi:ATP-binding protein [Parapedobacter sp. 2B3]|uniref:PAS domain-containing hybrid sensor histidine kinase/response regulator n=1 Tax=Parapedobacter sp. 2B3 TaxID=3342381 RepID=UPI0035B680DD
MAHKQTNQQRPDTQLRQTEKRLRELSGYLHAMIAAIEDIIFELDGNLVFRNVWVRDESLLFMPRAQFLGQTIQEVFGDQADLFRGPVEKAMREGKEAAIEYQHIDASVNKWYRAKAVPVEKSEDPSEYRLALIVQDITDRVRYLAELKEEKAKLEWYNALYDFSAELGKIASWEYDIKKETTVGTKQLYLIVERDPEDESDKDAAFMFLDDADKLKLASGIQRAVETDKPYDLELSITTARGNRKWIRTIGMPITENGETTKIRGLMMDVTDQVKQRLAIREIRDELARSNQLLDFSQHLSATGGWEYSHQTGKTYWTKQVYAIYEVPHDFDVSDSKKYLSFFSVADQKMIQETMSRCLNQRIDYEFEAQATLSKGHKKWVRVLGAPVVNDEQVIAMRGAVMDITKEKEDADRLLKAKEAAEEAAKAKTAFLSVMSHEIRTPLNGIIGIANLLRLRHTEQQAEIVDNLLFSADHLLTLINDILDLNKIDNNKLDLAQTEFSLGGLVRSIRNQFVSLADAKGIRLVSLFDQEIPEQLIGDPARLNQILSNLVSNAIKYTDQGKVTLSIQVMRQTDERVTLHFSVEDTGIGIPEELHEEIFADFKQAQQDAQRANTGTGLGLAITKRLVELHNGQIKVDSKPGAGSTFYFELDFVVADTGTPQVHPLPSPELTAFEGKLSALKLLLVEDNRVNVTVTREQLAYFGIMPDCAVGGLEALELLTEHTYHVAFVDLHMPGMDGYSLAATMQEKYPDTKVVIFTADIMADVRIKLAKMGIHTILNKPFRPEDMLAILLHTMQEKGIDQ